MIKQREFHLKNPIVNYYFFWQVKFNFWVIELNWLNWQFRHNIGYDPHNIADLFRR